jgi:hypothetical protein
MEQLFVTGGVILFIVICEIALWLLFSRRIAGICPPQAYDTSIFRYLSPIRLKIFAIIHTFTLAGVLGILFLLLW